MNFVSSSIMPVAAAGAPEDWALSVVAFVLGTCIGSFLNVCIYRLPAEESVMYPGSRCPQCARPISWYDNIPLLSWLWLRARCRGCQAAIPVRYPLVESAAGGLALLALLRFGLTPMAAVAFVFSAALLLITFVDFDHKFIPDEVSLPGIVVGLAASFLEGPPTPIDALLGVALGGGALWLVAWGYERATGTEGMGLGDVKLLAMIGAFLGWRAIPAVLVISSLTGSVVGLGVIAVRGAPVARRIVRRLGPLALVPFLRRASRRTELPFGPYLALGALIALYMPGASLPWHP